MNIVLNRFFSNTIQGKSLHKFLSAKINFKAFTISLDFDEIFDDSPALIEPFFNVGSVDGAISV